MQIENLVIDDLRSFREEALAGSLFYARTSQEGLAALRNYNSSGVKNLWLDHDLGLNPDGSDDTIMRVVDWLCSEAYEGKPYKVSMIYIHTSNPVGRKNIERSLRLWGYRTTIVFDPSSIFIVEEKS